MDGSKKPSLPNSTGGPVAAASDSFDRYEYRPPINLPNPRLRNLAAAFASSYLRVSGTWMNSMFFRMMMPCYGHPSQKVQRGDYPR